MNNQIVPDLKAIIRASWISHGCPSPIGVGFSGGADSSALLWILMQLSRENGFSVHAFHVNHGLRTKAADEEIACRSFCQQYGIKFHCAHIKMTGRSEDEARRMRYNALWDMAESSGCQCIALGHHMDDQAEGVLMRMMQGSLTGMCGMRDWASFPYHPEGNIRIWRPFLHVEHHALLAFLENLRLPWCEDNSNAETIYLRNYIRNEIIPRLSSRQEKLSMHFSCIADTLRKMHDDLCLFSDAFIRQHGRVTPSYKYIKAEPFDALPDTFKAAVIKQFLAKCSLTSSVPETTINSVIRLRHGQAFSMKNAKFFRSDIFLHLITDNDEDTFSLNYLTISEYQGKTGDGIRSQAIPAVFRNTLSIRTRKSGDRIKPFGMKNNQKLQDYFTDRKIPLPFRDHIPIICSGDEILWVVGIGASEACRISENKDAVFLEYSGLLPWE